MDANVAPGFEMELLNEEKPRTSNRFRRTEYTYDYGITHNMHHMLPNLLEASNDINKIYENMVMPTLKKYSGDHKYCVYILHKALKHKPIFIGGSSIDQFDSSEFLSTIYKVSQSNEDFLLTGELKVTVTIKQPDVKGSGRNKYKGAPRTGEKRRKQQTSVITIKNNDCLCGYRAIFVGIKYHELDIKHGIKNEYQWKQVKGSRKNKKPWTVDVQKEGAQNICIAAGLPMDQPLSFLKLQQLQESYLSPEYQLLVIDGKDPSNVIFRGPNSEKQICLEYIENHFNFIKEMNAYLQTSYYCAACNTGYSTTHKCKIKCQLCGKEPKCTEEDLLTCEICSRTFYNQQCFNNHKQTMCLEVKKCVDCEVEYYDKKQHKCDQSTCHYCSENYTVSPHYCYIKTIELMKLEKEDKKLKIIVCYDIESIQVTVGHNQFQHKAILLIAEIVCDKCWNTVENRKTHFCEICGPSYKEYFGLNCVKEFGDYVYNDLANRAAKIKSKVLVFAHNSSGYDGHFVFTDLFKRDYEDVNIIMKGLKVLLIDVSNVRFLDSLSFFQQPLAQLPKSFGISSHAIKGFFPHLFSKFENLDYIGAMPQLEYFGIKYMKKAAANQLKAWHTEIASASNYVFNYKKELVKYCANDVKILTMSVMIYRELFKNATKLDPTTRNFTLASVGFEYFRSVILTEKTIGICPVKGYSTVRNQSKVANVWLDYVQSKSQFDVLREQHKGTYFVDGYIKEENKVLEFFGCKWHGCPKCFKNSRDIKLKELNNLSYNEVYSKTLQKLTYFENRNFNLHHIWECQFIDFKRSSSELTVFSNARSSYYTNLELYGPANIRESFFGGRTNNLYFTYDCGSNEKIACLDFTSLYPHVLVSSHYPVGHPKIISEYIDNSISQYFGFIKCIVIPPKHLYLGVLPARINKKLYFPLCSKCAEVRNNNSCTHTDEERSLIGTWTSVELQKAIEKGYVIHKIIQVFHYDQKSDQIFQNYIRTWLKIKTEASGWPKNCINETTKNAFITDFESKEGVILNPNNMNKNEGLRYIAKLMLNTLWGKLGQNTNQTQTKLCNDYYDYAKIESDPSIVIKGEFMPTENTLIVNYKISEDIFERAGNTSPAIASFVTAYARLKLYNEMEKIETSYPGRVLYFDTDSIFYAYKTDQSHYRPSTGDFLGDLTDEIWKEYETEGAYISSFASSGPKNYGYKVSFPDGSFKSKCKIKGITLTDEVDKELNYDVIYNFAKEYSTGVKLRKTVPQQQFRADCHHNIFTNLFDKAYRVVSEKRRQIGNKTLPYGYVD